MIYWRPLSERMHFLRLSSHKRNRSTNVSCYKFVCGSAFLVRRGRYTAINIKLRDPIVEFLTRSICEFLAEWGMLVQPALCLSFRELNGQIRDLHVKVSYEDFDGDLRAGVDILSWVIHHLHQLDHDLERLPYDDRVFSGDGDAGFDPYSISLSLFFGQLSTVNLTKICKSYFQDSASEDFYSRLIVLGVHTVLPHPQASVTNMFRVRAIPQRIPRSGDKVIIELTLQDKCYDSCSYNAKETILTLGFPICISPFPGEIVIQPGK